LTRRTVFLGREMRQAVVYHWATARRVFRRRAPAVGKALFLGEPLTPCGSLALPINRRNANRQPPTAERRTPNAKRQTLLQPDPVTINLGAAFQEKITKVGSVVPMFFRIESQENSGAGVKVSRL
jgi:hypothetical protein